MKNNNNNNNNDNDNSNNNIINWAMEKFITYTGFLPTIYDQIFILRIFAVGFAAANVPFLFSI